MTNTEGLTSKVCEISTGKHYVVTGFTADPQDGGAHRITEIELVQMEDPRQTRRISPEDFDALYRAVGGAQTALAIPVTSEAQAKREQIRWDRLLSVNKRTSTVLGRGEETSLRPEEIRQINHCLDEMDRLSATLDHHLESARARFRTQG